VQLLPNQCQFRRRHLDGTASFASSITVQALGLLVTIPPARDALQLPEYRRMTHASGISYGLLVETAFIQSFNLASLLVGQLLLATHFTYLLPEKKEASLQAAGLFF
jgi:hypothetical protein